MSDQDSNRRTAPLEAPVERLVNPVSRFVASEASSGILLLAAVALALILANSPWSEIYANLKHLHLAITIDGRGMDMSLHHWTNDGLMVLFFFVLGLEIKRELLAGELRDIRQSSLVFFMALGGMLLPALVYLGVVHLAGVEGARGWGIPMATDTAFAIGLLALMGTRVPRVLTVLLTGIAILDDIGAVLVIGLIYTEGVSTVSLINAALCMAALLLLNIAGVRRVPLYLLLGVALWWFILQSGVHATTAGVLAALAVPARPHIDTRGFLNKMPGILRRFARVEDPKRSILEDEEQQALAQQAREVALRTVTPLQRWEEALQKPVILGIVPIFAFLNAGVVLPSSPGDFFSAPIALAAASGLVFGKSLGVSLFAGLGIMSGLCRMPEGMDRRHIIGLGMLTGIGFTMSLFINSLAFADAAGLETDAKLGILVGSMVSALLGASVLLWAHARDRATDQAPDHSESAGSGGTA